MNKTFFQRYKLIYFSLILFVIIDLGTLVPNLLISNHLKNDTLGINLAGRQRMLSQRLIKTLLQLRYAQEHRQDLTPILTEFRKVYFLFDQTLIAFLNGGITQDANMNTVYLSAIPISNEPAQNALQTTQIFWLPYKQYLQPLLENQFNPTELNNAIQYANQFNLDILELMNILTISLEQVANRKAFAIQLIQTIGIVLVTLNFFFLIFHVISHLKHKEEEIRCLQQQLPSSRKI